MLFLLLVALAGCSSAEAISVQATAVGDRAAAIRGLAERIGAQSTQPDVVADAAAISLEAQSIQKSVGVIHQRVTQVRDITPWWATLLQWGLSRPGRRRGCVSGARDGHWCGDPGGHRMAASSQGHGGGDGRSHDGNGQARDDSGMDRHEASIGQGVRRGMAKDSTGEQTMILGTAESLIGSIWAAFACLCRRIHRRACRQPRPHFWLVQEVNLAPASCCCGCAIDCECLASTYTLAFPAFTWGTTSAPQAPATL
jgi:hypothetical protein